MRLLRILAAMVREVLEYEAALEEQKRQRDGETPATANTRGSSPSGSPRSAIEDAANEEGALNRDR